MQRSKNQARCNPSISLLHFCCSHSSHDSHCIIIICKLEISYYPLPSGLFRNNLEHWLGDFARLLKVQLTSNEGMSNDAPIHKCESEIDHYTGHYVPYSLRRVCGL